MKSIFLAMLLAFSSSVGVSEPTYNVNDVKVKFVPDSPVVLLFDLTLNPGAENEKTIAGPWFAVGMTLKNDSQVAVTIQTLVFHVTALDKDGHTESTVVKIDPADYEGYFCTAHDPTYLEEVPAGGEILKPCYLHYISGLFSTPSSYSYLVEVAVLGWFGAANRPLAPLRKTINLVTQ